MIELLTFWVQNARLLYPTSGFKRVRNTKSDHLDVLSFFTQKKSHHTLHMEIGKSSANTKYSLTGKTIICKYQCSKRSWTSNLLGGFQFQITCLSPFLEPAKYTNFSLKLTEYSTFSHHFKTFTILTPPPHHIFGSPTTGM